MHRHVCGFARMHKGGARAAYGTVADTVGSVVCRQKLGPVGFPVSQQIPAAMSCIDGSDPSRQQPRCRV